MKVFILTALFVCSTLLTATDYTGIQKELVFLKNLCDKELLNQSECQVQRAKILKKFEKKEEDVWFCNYSGEKKLGEPIVSDDRISFSESASANVIVKEILNTAGLVGSFIVRPANVPNAMASVRRGNRYIEYNPSFVKNLKDGSNTNWSIYSVLAHEIGHHLQGHTLKSGGSRPEIELEADEYSGFILAKMGATLRETQKAMRTLGSNTTSGTHPDKNRRLSSIKVGWIKGQKLLKKSKRNINNSDVRDNRNDRNNRNERTTNYSFYCNINGENLVIDKFNQVLSIQNNYQRVAIRERPQHPNCAYDLYAPATGRYCVTHNGSVYFGTPIPIGQCQVFR